MSKDSAIKSRLLTSIRKFHPIYRMRQISVFRTLLQWGDIRIWRRMNGISFKVCLRLFRNNALATSGEDIEEATLRAVRQIIELKPNLVFWDVGANIGLYTWIVQDNAQQPQIIAFEPDPENANLIASTIKRHNFSNILLERSAASDTDGFVTFSVDTLSSVTGTILPQKATADSALYGMKESKQLRVPSVKLDSLKYTPPDLIKIDVEGAEFHVLRGGERLLREYHPILIFETLDQEKSKINDWLEHVGYQVWRLADEVPSGLANFIALGPEMEDIQNRLVKNHLLQVKINVGNS